VKFFPVLDTKHCDGCLNRPINRRKLHKKNTLRQLSSKVAIEMSQSDNFLVVLPIRQKGKRAIISQQKGNSKPTKIYKNKNPLKGTRGMAKTNQQWPKAARYVSRIRISLPCK
jgi:hypothetical protein